MTEYDIIKILEICSEPGNNYLSDDCAYRFTKKCLYGIFENALGLINRQKAENEKLSKEIITLKYGLQAASESSEWKSTAIKEFAERLKTKWFYAEKPQTYTFYGKVVSVKAIDNLVKEMTEVEE